MDAGIVKIFTSKDVPRLRYIAGILLGDILGLQWEIVTDKRKLGKNPVINYSSEELKGSFRISPVQLLSESGIKQYKPEIIRWKGLPAFFSTGEDSDLPFDIFAASFYLVSRYEEHLSYEADIYGRFPASASLAGRNNFLTIPVIDLWVREWAKSLVVRFQNLVFRKNRYSSMVTIDVDQPFEFLGKDVFRSLGGIIKDIGKKTGKAGDRYRTVTHGEKDPWDVFDYIFDAIKESGISSRFFIPTGDRSRYDRNPSWLNEDYRSLIKRIMAFTGFGLHPSYYASVDNARLQTESDRLKKITSLEISSSRFHYINLKFPDSYLNLLKSGITEDYSMGYPEEPGFRAGLARPFRFYDLLNDAETSLQVFPFQIMDGTLSQYKKFSPAESESIISSIIDETRRAGGTFISIWHNTTLLDNAEQKDWRKLFESVLKMQK